MQNFKIIIQGFDFYYLQKTKKRIQRLLNLLQIKNTQYFILPPVTTKFTVERSPHIDKKSREQFEKKKYKKIIYVQTKNSKIFRLVSFILKNITYPGIQLVLTVQFHDYRISPLYH